MAAQAAITTALVMDPAAAAKASPARLLISNPGHIYLASYDGSSFTTTLKQTVSGNPTWMAFVQPDLLYAVNEDGSDTRLFHLDVAGNKLGPEKQQTGSSGVVYLSFARNGTRMVGAAYGSAKVDVWDTSNGGLALKKTIPSGNSPSNPHQALLDPSGRFFAVNDLGADQVFIIDTKNDAFNIVNRVSVAPKGCGPRHGAFYPAGSTAATHYILLCEEGNLITVFDVAYATDKLQFSNPQQYSSFGSNPTPSGAAAGELVLASDNQHLYVSNRLTGAATDSIAHFKIVPAGNKVNLQFVGQTSTGGKLPRMFSISTDGKDLFVGNEGGDLGIVALRRGADGVLESTPRASIAMSQFSGGGPKYVQQIA